MLQLTHVRIVFAVFFPFVIGISTTAIQAQTTTDKLTIIGIAPGATALETECLKNWEQAHQYCDEVLRLFSENQLDEVKMKQYGPTHSNVQWVMRASKRLGDLREPASVDYSLRAMEGMRAFNREIANKLRSTKEGSKIAANAEEFHRKSMQKRSLQLTRVNKLLSDGKIENAEEEMDKIMVGVDNLVPWLNLASRSAMVNQVSPTRSRVELANQKKRESEAAVALSAAIEANAPNIDALLSSTESAISSIGSSGQADLDGKSIGGPAALQTLFSQWQVAHANLVRCTTLNWLGSELPLTVTPAQSIGSKLGTTDWEQAAAKLNARMTELLPKLIAADLKRSTDEKAAHDMYIGYLSTIGFMANRSAGAMVALCEQELEAIESRPGKLAASIKNYRKATDDVLLWRSRAAQSAAAAAKSVPVFESPELVPIGKSFFPVLRQGLDEIPPEWHADTAKLKTYVTNVQMINDKAGFSSFKNNSWATVMGEIDIEDELLKLQKDLLVSNQSPPLSPAAAKSIMTAKRKHLISVGGDVSSAQVEALGTRLSKLPANMKSFVPFSQIPVADRQLGQTLLRLNIKPAWVQHEHFFKKL